MTKVVLTENQQRQILACTSPLSRTERATFMLELVDWLRDKDAVGDGELFIWLRETQKRLYRFPVTVVPPKQSRHSLAQRTDGAAKKLVGARWFRD